MKDATASSRMISSCGSARKVTVATLNSTDATVIPIHASARKNDADGEWQNERNVHFNPRPPKLKYICIVLISIHR